MKGILSVFAVVVAVCCVSLPAPAEAQVVWSPLMFQFDHSDVDRAITAKYQISFHTCTLNPDGTIRDVTATPTQTSDVPLSVVRDRGAAVSPRYEADLSAITPLFSYPTGQYYVGYLRGIGLDGVLAGANSGVSNPFANPTAPGAPTTFRFAR